MRFLNRLMKFFSPALAAVSGVLLFAAVAAAVLNAGFFNAALHLSLIDKYDIYSRLEKSADKAIQDYFNKTDPGGPENGKQREQLASLADKAVTPEMIRLNTDTVVEGLFKYFSGEARFLPDIYLGPARKEPGAEPAEAAQNTAALSGQPLSGIDRISLNVVLMYMDRSDVIDFLSEIRLFKFALSHAPLLLLLLAAFLFALEAASSGRKGIRTFLFVAPISSGVLAAVSGCLALVLGRLYMPSYLASWPLTKFIGGDALCGYINGCVLRPAVYLIISGAVLSAAAFPALLAKKGPRGTLQKMISRLPVPASWNPGFAAFSGFLAKHGRAAFALLLVFFLAGALALGFAGMKSDFHAKDLGAAFERLRGTNTYATVVAARSEMVYSVEVRITDRQSGDPVQGVPMKLDGKLSGGGVFSTAGSSDESGRTRFTAGEGEFRLEYDQASFPGGYSMPEPYAFDVKAAGTTIITVHLEKAEDKKAGIAEVQVLDSENKPVENLELAAESRTAEEDAVTVPGKVYSFTNSEGAAVFKLEEGQYTVSFVESAFPEKYTLPGPVTIEVAADASAKYFIKLAGVK